MNEPSKPVNEIRLGAIKAAIWRNETETGPRFNTTLSRIYRDGEQWRSTDSFGREDLLLVAKVANEAHTWIYTQGRETAPSPPAASAPNPGTPPARSPSSNHGRNR